MKNYKDRSRRKVELGVNAEAINLLTVGTDVKIVDTDTSNNQAVEILPNHKIVRFKFNSRLVDGSTGKALI